MRVGIYTRLSRDPDGTQTATARQEADCRRLADREGWLVVEVYEDTDLSGYTRDLHRPDFQRMLDDVGAGRVEAVVVWKLDRLSRQPGQFEAVVSACERAGARIVSVHESADMTSPAGLAMMRVGMAFAALESETISLRTRRAKAEAAEQGEPNGGGLRPYGLTQDKRSIVEPEAALIREAAARVLAGEGVTTIAKDWSRRGVKTSRGNEWAVTALTRMLRNPRLAGRRVHKGRVIPSDVIPAILEPDVAERVRLALAPRGDGFVRRPRALSGLVRCGLCGEQMKVKHRQSGSPLYRCFKTPGSPACGSLVVSAGPLEALVGALLAGFLNAPDLADAMGGSEAAELARQIGREEAKREALVHDHYVTGLVSRRDFMGAAARLDDTIRRLTGDLNRLRRRDLLADLQPGETVLSAWADRPVHWRREIAGALIDHVSIARAAMKGRHIFDPDRVTVRWRE